MPPSKHKYDERLARLMETLSDSTVARLLWTNRRSGSEGLHYPVYQVSPGSKKVLDEANALEKVAVTLGKTKGLPPAIRHGPFTGVTISVRSKTTIERATVDQVRRHLLAELSSRTAPFEAKTAADIAKLLPSLRRDLATETPYVRTRIEALTKLVDRRREEELLLRYPQQDVRAYLPGSAQKQVALRANGLLLVSDLDRALDVSLPGTRKRTKRSDRVETQPAFNVGRTDYHFTE